MNYKKLNLWVGWAVFALATIVYFATAERTASFWDCGEYIATAYKLQVGHPPGAPLFQLIGRFFSLFAFGNTGNVALMVNLMSGLASSFTILFLFWSITYLAKKLIESVKGELNNSRIITIIGSGVVGALAYAFSDSFWFSAVEGEVYAMSTFFTAIVFWAMLRWEQVADKPHHFRWIILIAFLIGLSIGVHLLNLLAIPAITFIYYFKRYESTTKGIIVTGAISIGILAVVMYGIIPMVVGLAGGFEKFFVNNFGLPYNTGTIIYFIILIGLIYFGLRYTQKKGKVILNTIILSITVILIGYSSFFILVIRSNANPPIDENNPENAISLLAYLNREQYGTWPILSGYYYNANVIGYEDGKPVYSKKYVVLDDKREIKSFFDEKDALAYVEKSGKPLSVKGKYVITDKRVGTEPQYDDKFKAVFPRMWSSQRSVHPRAYKIWAHQGRGEAVPFTKNDGTQGTKIVPTPGENLKFFLKYQVGHMYFRYFLWNFAGRQNDVQGHGNLKDGNWQSGIKGIDKKFSGPQENIPEEMTSNKANNHFYFLPLILGLIGFIFHMSNNYRHSIVVLLLFIMTGLAIVVYLNQYPYQPRERDYAYAASFMAFCIWIGLGVVGIVSYIDKKMIKGAVAVAISGIMLLAVPGLMAKEGWDDHDRSAKTLTIEVAKNYLNSCKKNGVVFTNGDNDTFPLWYAQEVEDVRTDLKVVNLSLFNTDWYIDQMARKAYSADGIPISMDKNKYVQGTRDMLLLIDDKTPRATGVLKDWFLDKIVNKDPEIYATYINNFKSKLYAVLEASKLKVDYPNDYAVLTGDEIQLSQIVQFVSQTSGDQALELRTNLQLNEDAWKILVKSMNKLLDNTIHSYIDLEIIMEWIRSDEEYTMVTYPGGRKIDFIPTQKLRLKVDSVNVINSGIVSAADADEMVKYVDWVLEENMIQKNHIMVLDFLTTNQWKRPVHFAVTTGPDSYIHLMDYFQHDGLVYTLVPIKYVGNPEDDYYFTMQAYGRVDVDSLYEMLINRFDYASLYRDDVYYDETARRPLTSYRSVLFRLVLELTKKGDLDRAGEVMQKAMEMLSDKVITYDISVLPAVKIYFRMGKKEEALALARTLLDKFRAEFKYYAQYKPDQRDIIENDLNILYQTSGYLYQVLLKNEEEETADEVKLLLDQLTPYATTNRR